MNNFFVIILSILLIILIGVTLLQVNSNNKFNNWAAKCLEDGGIVSQTKHSLFTVQWECIANGKIINHED